MLADIGRFRAHYRQRDLVRLAGEHNFLIKDNASFCQTVIRLYTVCSQMPSPTFDQLSSYVPFGPATPHEIRMSRGDRLNEWWADGEIRERRHREGAHQAIVNLMQSLVNARVDSTICANGLE